MKNNFCGLKTDLYELTMAAGYYMNRLNLKATFELLCYKAPPNRSYFIVCGLSQVVDYLLNLHFSREDIDFLRKLPAFKSVDKGFFDYLKGFEFTGSLWAMPEGEVFFPLEPVIQVTAPIIEAQIIETYMLSMTHIQTLIATKASRVTKAASSDGKLRSVVDFGSRRAHGPQAAILAARAAYIGGCAGTSNAYAARKFKIPVYGTMAHSWVSAFGQESKAFLNYQKVFPKNTILLIDTYDTIAGVRNAVQLKKKIQGVRIDSGDLNVLSRRVRNILDKAGLTEVKIVASGNLNEYKIHNLVRSKAPIDTFGVGTDMVTSRDLPSLDLIYKLVQTETPQGDLQLKAKYSQGKVSLPGRKQVYRFYTPAGTMSRDVICLFNEKPPSGVSRRLLKPIIENGRLVQKLSGIEKIKISAKKELDRLPSFCSGINSRRYLKVDISLRLLRLSKKVLCR